MMRGGLLPIQLALWDYSAMPKPSGQDFYTRLLEALRDANLPTTQTSIADYLGINQSAVAKWKSGESFPEYENALRLAQRASVSVSWLWIGAGDKKSQSEMDEQTVELLRAWHQMPDQARDVLLEFARLHAAAQTKPTPTDGESPSDNNNKH
jgi:transcriptional regulator with XRE-family HTH domain